MPCWSPYKNFILTLQSKRQIKQENDANNQDGQKHEKSKAIPIPEYRGHFNKCLSNN